MGLEMMHKKKIWFYVHTYGFISIHMITNNQSQNVLYVILVLRYNNSFWLFMVVSFRFILVFTYYSL